MTERRERRGGRTVGIGLLGCGTVGGGVLRLLEEGGPALGERVGAKLEVRRVLVRDMDKERSAPCDRAWLTTSPDDVLSDPSVDVVVEVMGGEEEAGALIERAIDAGKGVVTANKLLLAKRGPALIERAQARGVDLAFEGAVGGGIPIIRTLREAFASDSVGRIVGIVNGTCNYVLTRMREAGLGMEEAIREAQVKGYAEAEPSLDVDGHDAAHKLVVLAMLGFGARVDASRVPVEGIRGVDEVDHRFAERFGFAIKHLAVGVDHPGGVELRVHPTLVPRVSVLANVSGVLNAIFLEGKALGPCLVYGRGAGDLPTAVSVVSDVLDVARSIVAEAPGLQTRAIAMAPRPLWPARESESRFYLRFAVDDRPGVMARLAGALGDAGASIDQIVQEAGDKEGEATVVILTRRAREGAVDDALTSLGRAPFLRRPPRRLRIEDA